MDGLTAEERGWCAEWMAARAGRPITLAGVEPVASRLARVWRLHAPETPIAFYLKRYPPHEPRHIGLTEHFALLQGITAAIEASSDLAPYRAVACLPENRLILSEETPGTPIAWLHRDLPRSAQTRRQAERAWAGIGRWLALLHASGSGAVVRGDVQAAARHAFDVAEYTRERFERWALVDPAQSALARAAIECARTDARSLADSPPPLVPCHGDVSTMNVLVGDRTGLIDFDDLRFDFAAVDLSVVLLEIAQFSRVGSLLAFPGLTRRFTRAFRTAYGGPWPERAAFRLPHLRNLSVFALTLAERRGPLSLSQLSTRAHYRTTIKELRRTIG